MKNNKQYKIAKEFNVLEKIKRFEGELLKVNGVVGVEFDLCGLYDNINQVIFLTEYNIPSNEQHFNNRKELIKNVIEVANNNGLTRTEDSIEDYGRHFYFVTKFNKDWK